MLWVFHTHKKTFLKHLNVASHSRSGSHHFSFEHLIDVLRYLLSFCYLLAEWLAVNIHKRVQNQSMACVPIAYYTHKPSYKTMHIHLHTCKHTTDLSSVSGVPDMFSHSSVCHFEGVGSIIHKVLPVLYSNSFFPFYLKKNSTWLKPG